MSRVHTEIDEVEIESDTGSGRMIDGLKITCNKCGHSVEVYGTSDASARRGAVMLKEECPNEENNYYVVEWEGDGS